MHSSTSSSNHQRAARAFTLGTVALLLTLTGTYWLVRTYFTLTGDLLPLPVVAERLINHRGKQACMYLNAISSDTDRNLKFNLFKRAPSSPEIVVMGSSRTLAFYQPMFIKPFLNMGRAYQFPIIGKDILDLFKKTGRIPNIVLIGIDFWWFNSRYMKISQSVSKGVITKIDPNDLYQLQILVKGSWNDPARFRLLPRAATLPPCPIGVIARLKNVGFLSDGGVTYLYNRNQFHDPQFRDTLDRIRKNKGNFSQGERPDMQQIQEVLRFILALKKQGVKTIVYSPPVAPTVFQAMQKSGGYTYITQAFDLLRNAGIELHDYLNPMRLGLNDCEFIDGFHPGDVANALLLLDLVKQEPALAKVVNLPFLQQLAANRGLSIVISDALTLRREGDYLGLGCTKQPTVPLKRETLSQAYLHSSR